MGTRKDSGLRAADHLEAFLYLLLRDELAFGIVERIIRDVENVETVVFSEPHIASYVSTLAPRLYAAEPLDYVFEEVKALRSQSTTTIGFGEPGGVILWPGKFPSGGRRAELLWIIAALVGDVERIDRSQKGSGTVPLVDR